MNQTDQQQQEEREQPVPWDDLFPILAAAPGTGALVRRHRELWEESRLRGGEMSEEEEEELQLLFTQIWERRLNATDAHRECECMAVLMQCFWKAFLDVIYTVLFTIVTLISTTLALAAEQSILHNSTLASMESLFMLIVLVMCLE